VSFDSSQFFERRPMPIRVPRMVARITPMMATFSVFRTPISRAVPKVSVGDSIEKGEAGCDVASGEVRRGVADQIPSDRGNDANDDDLPDHPSENRVGPRQPHAAPRSGSGGGQARIGGGLGHRAAVSDAGG
jgi:hypothetical protein